MFFSEQKNLFGPSYLTLHICRFSHLMQLGFFFTFFVVAASKLGYKGGFGSSIGAGRGM